MGVVRGFLLAFAGAVAAPAAHAAIPDAELAVLRDFYASTGGEHWGTTEANFQPWFGDPDPCNWFGVFCDDAHEHVTVIALSVNNLTGALPASLAKLTRLRALAVDSNRLGGTIPSLAGLTELQAVFVEDNRLGGPLPSFEGLANLGYFAADHNQLTGHIPASVSAIPRLQYFVVDHNQLSGRVPRAPATLSAFSAALCPNLLDPAPSADPAIDAGWNTATGLAAWWSGPGSPCTAAPEADALRAFATSTVGSGDLHSWSDVTATNLTGLAAADAICQARATDANLRNPGAFVAWLSDRDNDAYCRVFGKGGRMADRCGETELPAGAGPWLRTDDTPFAATIEEALSANVVYSTLNFDEFGNRFLEPAESFSSTARDGAFLSGDCEHWSAASNLQDRLPALGSNLSSGGDWTFDGHGAGCSTQQRLTCLQKGSAPPLHLPAQHGRREAFETAADVSGALGGIAGADAVCRNAAAAAGLYRPESFKALVTTQASSQRVADRFEHDGPWYRRDGLLFAHDKAELVSGAVTLPLNVTENGAYLGVTVALTGTHSDGTPSDLDCNAWTSANALGNGSLGNAIAFFGSGGHNWLSPAQVSCAATLPAGDWPHKLYCLADADVVFHGEFEGLPVSP